MEDVDLECTTGGNPNGMDINVSLSADRLESILHYDHPSTNIFNEAISQTSELEDNALVALIHLESPGLPVQNVNVSSKRELCLSKLDIHTTIIDIQKYITAKGINELDNIRIQRLTRKNQDISLLSFVSFKIDTNTEIAATLLSPNLWPAYCNITDFVHKPNTNRNIAACLNAHIDSNYTTNGVNEMTTAETPF